jgi:hypothetical protein
MRNKWSLRPTPSRRGSKPRRPRLASTLLCGAAMCTFHWGPIAARVPPWMQAQVSAPLPAHDEKTSAVLMYADTVLTVRSTDKFRRVDRRVYRILRPDGARRGTVFAVFGSRSRVTDLHAWCIAADGKDYELKERDAAESSLGAVAGAELISDIRAKVLQLPAAVPGSLVGYEVEIEQRPEFLADQWIFQDIVPVREAHYTVELPRGWQYRSAWLNYADKAPVASGDQWQWTVSDVKAIRLEGSMPPWQGVAGGMWIAFIPPGGQQAGPQTWRELGTWYLDLTRGRREASPEIKHKVAELTASTPQLTGKMRALANFVQSDVRYVAVELGIGGLQPHAAAEVFAHGYGDCKDKVTLLSSMLKEIGVESTYVMVYSQRGAVTGSTPPNVGFNHAILAIRLPEGVEDPSLLAVLKHAQLGRILLVDPTNPYTPFGALPGQLQGGYGLLVAPDGGELVRLPQLPADWNGVQRTASMTLDEAGDLRGEVQEVLTGERAAAERGALARERQDTDQIRVAESHLGSAFTTFRLVKASVDNLQNPERPVEWHYTFEAAHYAKTSGDLLIVRPRVLGNKSSALLETREPREYPVEFDAAQHDVDEFEIALPAGYQVDDLPTAVDVDYGFASYHSKTELAGHSLRYRRTFDIRELSVPVAKAAELKTLYRIIEGDERASAVLKRTTPGH